MSGRNLDNRRLFDSEMLISGIVITSPTDVQFGPCKFDPKFSVAGSQTRLIGLDVEEKKSANLLERLEELPVGSPIFPEKMIFCHQRCQ